MRRYNPYNLHVNHAKNILFCLSLLFALSLTLVSQKANSAVSHNTTDDYPRNNAELDKFVANRGRYLGVINADYRLLLEKAHFFGKSAGEAFITYRMHNQYADLPPELSLEVRKSALELVSAYSKALAEVIASHGYTSISQGMRDLILADIRRFMKITDDPAANREAKQFIKAFVAELELENLVKNNEINNQFFGINGYKRTLYLGGASLWIFLSNNLPLPETIADVYPAILAIAPVFVDAVVNTLGVIGNMDRSDLQREKEERLKNLEILSGAVFNCNRALQSGDPQ